LANFLVLKASFHGHLLSQSHPTPFNLLSLTPTSRLAADCDSMEDVENPRSSTKGSDDGKQVEGTVTVTQTSSAANLSHLVSEKLASWGVESRGTVHARPRNLIDL
jgi:hypothetical protein